MATFLDASNILWPFVKAFIYDNTNDIIYSPEFNHFANAIQQNQKICLRNDAIWIDINDIETIDFPINHCSYYNVYFELFVFNDIKEMFTCLYDIYYQVLNTNILNERRLNCIKAYEPRFSRIQKVIEQYEFKSRLMDIEKSLSNFTI